MKSRRRVQLDYVKLVFKRLTDLNKEIQLGKLTFAELVNALLPFKTEASPERFAAMAKSFLLGNTIYDDCY